MTMETFFGGFHPANYSNSALHNIRAVAAATGVPSITLRSWERRYGMPEPQRDDKGYRLYSERDIAVVKWLRERVRQGIGISRAVNMLHVLEYADTATEPGGILNFESLRGRLLGAISQLDEQAVSQVIAEGLMVASVEDVALRLLQPALCEVGERWAQGTLSVTSEHVGSNVIRFHLAQLIRASPPPLRHHTVIVGCAPGEQHEIGVLMIALFLRRRGFNVIYAGANIEANSLLLDVERARPSAVCLSAGTPDAAQSLRDLYREMAETYSGVLAYGGRFFNEDDSRTRSVAGSYLGADAACAVTQLERLLLG
ncbi:MAG: MerR family transcriptional regulator [Chloroflexota bacterium]